MQRSNVDYNQFIYQDTKGEVRVKSPLKKLLMLTQPELKETREDMLLQDFVKVTQSKWLRDPKLSSRWDQTESDLNQDLAATIKTYLHELGLLQNRTLSKEKYDVGIITGCASPNMAKCFFNLQDLASKNPAIISKLIVSGTTNDISQYLPNLEAVYSAFPARFKKEVTFPEKLTELSGLKFFLDNMLWPEGFDPKNVVYIPNESKELSKPRLDDAFLAINKYLQEHHKESKLSIAVLSQPIFHYRQGLIFLPLAEQHFVEIVSAKHDTYPILNKLSGSTLNASSGLDELARLAFKLNEFIQHKENLQRLNLIVAKTELPSVVKSGYGMYQPQKPSSDVGTEPTVAFRL